MEHEELGPDLERLDLFESELSLEEIDLHGGDLFWPNVSRFTTAVVPDTLVAKVLREHRPPRVWAFFGASGESAARVAAALATARVLGESRRRVLVLDGDVDRPDLTRWAGSFELEGWIDYLNYGVSLPTASTPLPWEGAGSRLLGVGSFIPMGVGKEEIGSLLGRLSEIADDILVVAPVAESGLLWAGQATVAVLCVDRLGRPIAEAREAARELREAGAPLAALFTFGLVSDALVDSALTEVTQAPVTPGGAEAAPPAPAEPDATEAFQPLAPKEADAAVDEETDEVESGREEPAMPVAPAGAGEDDLAERIAFVARTIQEARDRDEAAAGERDGEADADGTEPGAEAPAGERPGILAETGETAAAASDEERRTVAEQLADLEATLGPEEEDRDAAEEDTVPLLEDADYTGPMATRAERGDGAAAADHEWDEDDGWDEEPELEAAEPDGRGEAEDAATEEAWAERIARAPDGDPGGGEPDGLAAAGTPSAEPWEPRHERPRRSSPLFAFVGVVLALSLIALGYWYFTVVRPGTGGGQTQLARQEPAADIGTSAPAASSAGGGVTDGTWIPDGSGGEPSVGAGDDQTGATGARGAGTPAIGAPAGAASPDAGEAADLGDREGAGTPPAEVAVAGSGAEEQTTAEAEPEPAPERAPAAGPAAAEDTTPSGAWTDPVGAAGWAIHLYSQPDSNLAKVDIAELNRRGMRAVWKAYEIAGKGRWYRVYVGSFPTRAAANAAIPDLKERLRTDWAAPVRF